MMKTFKAIGRLSVFVVLCSASVCVLQAQAVTFKFSSIGYHPQGAKLAVVEDVPEDKKMSIVLYEPSRRNPKFPVLLGATVYKVENVKAIQDPNQQGPSTKKLLVDFSDFKTPGTYELRIEGTDIKSDPIKINDFLYWDAMKPIVKSFYFQRCGQDIEDKTLNLFHAACHLKDAQYINNSRALSDDDESIDVVGGWHNGGDYTKYVTSTALSAARLMTMDEWNAKPFKFFRMEYPLYEPGYGATDDLHHEIKAGLDWLMVMQRRDGAVYRKVAGKKWPGNVAPEDDDQPRYIYGITSQDTANAAAALAMAARDFKTADLGYSVKSLMAAEKAWSFLDARSDMIIQHSESDFSGSGEFIDSQATMDTPYRLWAAAELYASTGKDKYHNYFKQHITQASLQRFSWMNPMMQGAVDYLLYAKNPDPKTAAALKEAILRIADAVASNVKADAYSVGVPKYGVSSNQEIAERGIILMDAYRLTGKTDYRDAASRLVSYFFGVNPLGMTYVTGFAGKSVNHPTHRWMIASGKLIPGYVVDGPDEAATDGKTPTGQGAASYVDDAAAKSVNEPKLLNNASLACLLALLNDAYNVSAKDDQAGPKSPLDFQLAPEKPKKK
jgi:endoglucanase